VIRIDIPPLRDRRDDIPALVAHFLDQYRSGQGAPPTKLSESAMTEVMPYYWPGTVRQLENTILRAVVLSADGMISTDELDLAAPVAPPTGLDYSALVREGAPLKKVLADVERDLIEEALRQAGGNRSEAARSLHIYRRYLYQKMDEYGLE
jgi:DNA-binding NtrC family response regulator